ncbi:HipA domain-containing protein (plasmid) [Pseudomonas luteola]|uniref:type II toxin-antitoxin system HipA family toxin n=1 Tax=Pseudomonas luteola TaxID=47886 RepID=UPI003D9FFE47
MFLAALIGSDIPEISLSELSLIDNLPPTPLPDEAYAYGIKRFDRGTNGQRIHTEHFAQVSFEYAQNKYERHNYEEIARKLKAETLHCPDNIRQITLRLLANVLMGNGDAHLKNWSLIYRDTQQADLSPAYDIVFTRAYMGDERELALNMGSHKALV